MLSRSVAKLIVAASVAVAAAVFCVLAVRANRRLQAFDGPFGGDVVARFRKATRPMRTLALDTLPQAAHGDELLDPGSTLPTSYLYEPDDLRRLNELAQHCAGEVPAALAKAGIWAELQCGKRAALPERFFDEPPYMHPGGRSFVALAGVKDKNEFAHVLERDVLAGTAAAALQAMVRGRESYGDESFVYLRDGSPGRSYAVYPLAAWRRHLAEEFVAIDAKSVACDDRAAGFCWQARRQELQVVHKRYQIGLGASILALVLVLAIIAALGSRQLAAESTEREFMLRVLTHELRTPVAGMRLALESFRQEYAALSGNLQTRFLDMAEDVQRLTRLIEASKSYLVARRDGKTMRVARQEVPSINDFVESTLERYGEVVTTTLATPDVPLQTDVHWLGVCLCNLVDNALQHGAPPVKVAVGVTEAEVEIEVVDGGRLAESAVRFRPFAKAQASQGLGLGLYLTRKLLEDLDGRLTVSTEPTTFSIRLKRGAA